MFHNVNKVIRSLVAANFFMYSGWGFLAPVFAIFIVQGIQTGGPEQAAKVAGFASFVYWIVKSLVQIPVSRYFDKLHGEKDDFWFMFFGLVITGISPFGFIFAYLPWHIYALQAVHAVGMAFFIPSWNAIFTRHIDKGREAYEWALDSTTLGIGTGITGALGGLLVANLGFSSIFILAGVLSFTAAAVLLSIHKNILPKDHILSWLYTKPF